MFRNGAGSWGVIVRFVPRPWLGGPVAMETIMWGNWRRSTLETSLEYISIWRGPRTPLTFNPAAIVSRPVYPLQVFRPPLRNV